MNILRRIESLRLREHRTSLTALAKVVGYLETASDPEELLGEIDGKSQVQVERIVARRTPVRRTTERVKRQAVKRPQPTATLFCAPQPPIEDRVRLAFSVSEEDFEEFEKAKAILSRKLPKGMTLEQAFNELVRFYLGKKTPKPERDVRKPRQRNRHIPAATRDEVLRRDSQRCTYVAPDGTRCEATHHLQLDHIDPYAMGGSHDPANLRVLCAAHNQRRNDRVPLRNCRIGGSARSAADRDPCRAPRSGS